MISFNHDILVNLVQNKTTIDQVEFGTIRIGKPIEVIEILEINDIYFFNPSSDSYNYECSNYTITERIGKLREFDGWIYLAGGLSIGVRNQKIEDFRLTKLYVEGISHFTRDEIISFHGKPDYEITDTVSWGYDFSVDGYVLVYNSKKLNFYIEPEKYTLKEIYTGHLDKSK